MKRLELTAAVAAGIVGCLLALSVSIAVGRYAFPPAPPPLSLPERLAASPPALIEIPVSGDAKQLKWFCADDGIKLIPWPDGTKAIFHATEAGIYHVVVYGIDAKGRLTEPCVCRLAIGSPPKPPPGPGPRPNDPLVAKLQAAYASETAADKAQSLAGLAELYQQSAKAATDRQDIATWGALFSLMDQVASGASVWGKIMGVQKLVQAELSAALPANTAASLDDAGRKLASQTFARIAAALKSVAP